MAITTAKRDYAYFRGRDDSRIGKPVSANPYPQDNPLWCDWDNGWARQTAALHRTKQAPEPCASLGPAGDSERLHKKETDRSAC